MSATANTHRPDAATIAAMVEEARGVAVAAADDVGLPFERENLELLCARQDSTIRPPTSASAPS